MRRLLSAPLLLLALAAPAQAVTRDELNRYTDRAAAVWAGRQAPNGEFRDPHTGRPSSGYGNVMLGYSLMRAGARRHDARLIRAGVRGVSTALGELPSQRGVFDLLSMAAAYNFARAALPQDPEFVAARPRWEAYLAASGPPNIENKAQACIVAPDCFHNHEAVGAAANLEFLRTGIQAPALGDPALLQSTTLQQVGEAEPRFATGSARIVGPQPRSGLALLSDTGVWPLAYHALSSAMLARSVSLLGAQAPATSRAALRRTALALAGFMAPDGTVAYIGRRQQEAWSLAAAIGVTENAAPAAADRAFARLRARYPLTHRGLPIVPRKGSDAFSPKGVDGRGMVFNGLTLFLLNLAADDAPRQAPRAARLPADRDGAFIDTAQSRFAAVRHGNVWYAVHARRNPPDLRNDVGLVAAKWRSPSGAWVDVLHPRPFVLDGSQTAGPVVVRGGVPVVAGGGAISLRRGGGVRVGGALPLEFTPLARGVKMLVRARPGETVAYTAYVPGGKAAQEPVIATPAPVGVTVKRGYASCCDLRMMAARYRVRAPSSGRVSFTMAVPEPVAGAATKRAIVRGLERDGGGTSWWLVVLGVAAVAAVALWLRRRAVVHRSAQ